MYASLAVGAFVFLLLSGLSYFAINFMPERYPRSGYSGFIIACIPYVTGGYAAGWVQRQKPMRVVALSGVLLGFLVSSGVAAYLTFSGASLRVEVAVGMYLMSVVLCGASAALCSVCTR